MGGDDDEPVGQRSLADQLAAAAARLAACELPPPGADRFDCVAGALDDLARLAELLPGLAEQLSGRPNDALASHGRQLSTEMTAHRNALIAPRPPRPGPAAEAC